MSTTVGTLSPAATAALAHLQDDGLAEARGLLEADLVGEDEAVDGSGVCSHEREPHVGRKRLGERLEPHDAPVHVQRKHRRLQLEQARHVVGVAWGTGVTPAERFAEGQPGGRPRPARRLPGRLLGVSRPGIWIQ